MEEETEKEMESSIQSFHSRTEHRLDINWEMLSTVNDTVAFTGYATYWPVGLKNKTFPSCVCFCTWTADGLVLYKGRRPCVYTHSDVGKEQAVKTASNARTWVVVIVALLNRWHLYRLLFLEIVIKKETRHDRWSKLGQRGKKTQQGKVSRHLSGEGGGTKLKRIFLFERTFARRKWNSLWDKFGVGSKC